MLRISRAGGLGAVAPGAVQPMQVSGSHPYSSRRRAVPAPGPRSSGVCSAVDSASIRFMYTPNIRQQLSFRKLDQTRSRNLPPTDVRVEVDCMLEGSPTGFEKRGALETLQEQAEADVALVVRLAVLHKAERDPLYKLPRCANVSLVLCDDRHIKRLNFVHRNQDKATDVLSFEMPDDLDYKVHLPMKLLGDLVVSLDTAQRQATERRYTLRDELRVLLVHGVLHLCGCDHERGEREADEMAAFEKRIMQELGWQGCGLIQAASQEEEEGEEAGAAPVVRQPATALVAAASASASANTGRGSKASTSGSGAAVSSSSRTDSSTSSGAVLAATPATSSTATPARRARREHDIKIVALDMDGTLLDSRSLILPSSVAVIRAACAAGVRVLLATGKARPAALNACLASGLQGDELLVSSTGPGIFLQGLAVHGRDGAQLSDRQMPAAVVASVMSWCLDNGVSCVAFLGDTCAALAMTSDLRQLHELYWEPLAQVMPLEEVLAGAPVRKLLLMAPPEQVAGLLVPHWTINLQGTGAGTMQALPNMLEIVPDGVDKWVGAQLLLANLGLSAVNLMACGDGGNDLALVANAGVGIAMGNAVPEVKFAAHTVVASHNDGGIAEAFERFVL